jgi:hypothetical protein
MKTATYKFFIIATSLIIAFPSLQALTQTNPEKRVIATLSQGETLANDENCFLLDKDPESISFVTMVKNGNEKLYYCFGKDGKKTGPVTSPDPS